MSESLCVAYVVNHVAFFISHRLPLAMGARKTGFDVVLFTGQAGSEQMERIAVARLTEEGIYHKRTISRSAGMNPFIELVSLLQLIWFMIRRRPDLVHCASPKGVLYGGIAARICRVRGLVLAISGMGFAFTDTTNKGTLYKLSNLIYRGLAHFAFRHPNVYVIIQNKDDRSALVGSGLVAEKGIVLIPGSGVDLGLFSNCKILEKKSVVLMPARMLRAKGVYEFVEAARLLSDLTEGWQFVLAGAADYDNPTAVTRAELERWQSEGVVRWVGHVENMVPLFQEASIVCLPSHREGMPKALLEAAAAGCAIVTTDVTGCREAIEPGVTGDLVPVLDVKALARTLLLLIKDGARRQEYGNRGRQRAVELFSAESVVQKTMNIYKMLLNK